MGRQREVSEMSHEYLVETVQVLEGYITAMWSMMLQFHPYMVPSANEIGELAQKQQSDIENRYPISQIVVASGLIRPN